MALGEPRKLHHKYRFTVEVDGFASAAFTAMSSVDVEAEDVELHEGGRLIPHKEPGKLNVADITLDRGIGLDEDMHDWLVEMIDFVNDSGAVPEDLKRNLELVERLRDGSEVRRITLFNAYPKKYAFGEWSSDGNEAVMEQLVLRYDYPKKTTDE